MLKKICIGAAVFIIAIVAATTIVIAVYADDVVARYQNDFMGLAIDVKDVKVDWIGFGVTLEEVAIYPKGLKDPPHLLASATSMHVAIAPLDLLRRVIRIKELSLDHPTISFIRLGKRLNNWEPLDVSSFVAAKSKAAGPTLWLEIDAIEIEDGTVSYQDRVKGGRFELTEFDASLENIVAESDPAKMPTTLKIEGKLGKTGAPVKAQGKLNLLAPGINFAIHARVDDAPVTYFSSFYAGEVPFPVVAGRVDIKSDLKSMKSYLNSTHHAAMTGLKVGGGPESMLINALVLKKKTIYATATVNGDLSEGDLAVSAQVSRLFGNSILADAKALSPVQGLGRGIAKTGDKAGSAVQKLFRRVH